MWRNVKKEKKYRILNQKTKRSFIGADIAVSSIRDLTVLIGIIKALLSTTRNTTRTPLIGTTYGYIRNAYVKSITGYDSVDDAVEKSEGIFGRLPNFSLFQDEIVNLTR